MAAFASPGMPDWPDDSDSTLSRILPRRSPAEPGSEPILAGIIGRPSMMEAIGLSDPGCVRPNNEDYFALVRERGLYVVADGMGGAQAGEHASRLAVETVVETILNTPQARRRTAGLRFPGSESQSNGGGRRRRPAGRHGNHAGGGSGMRARNFSSPASATAARMPTTLAA